ncbi:MULTISPECIES: hypothetical protein [Companilactobacillus]|uniref:Uncharacterized protein n=2 Tax=Companilactobacillus TaxID=2767879 RepID=A0ABW9P442_9LACO|nr:MULTISPECIES: hypothetical protein [Companilactobacillus]AKP66333.1 hypothetical protein ABM34_01380 [Companilactobacillus ginsenosidimutans]MQS43964.1 hypothetical protein [Companilactobacillus mishanensis]
MENSKFYVKRILSYVYLQPEKSVSSIKVLNKFKTLNIDQLNSILKDMKNDGYIEFDDGTPMYEVGKVDDDKNNKTTNISSEKHHIILTLEGQQIAEERKYLAIKTLRQMVLHPIINSIISTIIGIIIGWLVRPLF